MALIEQRLGHETRSRRRLLEVLGRYPRSALAGRALTLYLSALRRSSSEARVVAWLQALNDRQLGAELGEAVSYRLARALERTGASRHALDLYLKTARRYPYPKGAYHDDCLFRAAALERRLGRPRQAISRLDDLLSFRESAALQGSYERSRYAQAQFLKAEIYRDDLGIDEAAREAFRRVFIDFETSLLRDDALWQEALVARRADDLAGACAALRLLRQALPESRYAACANVVCPELGSKGRCHRYILRDVFRPSGIEPSPSLKRPARSPDGSDQADEPNSG